MDESKVNESCELITKHFDLEPSESSKLTIGNDLEELKILLAQLIKTLIDQDFQRLLNGFYRIDVDEFEVRKALSITEPDKIGEELAQLIIDRELKKVETRRKFRSS